MFNITNVVTNDQPTMRPIIKRPQSTTSLKMDSCTTTSSISDIASLPPHYSAQTMVTIDNKTVVFGYDNYQCGRMLTSTLLSNPYICIVNTIAAHARKSMADSNLCHDSKKVFKINENAVRLDDIDEWWYTENETVTLPSLRQHKEYDDVDLDLIAIHQEAQEYNDCSDLQQKLDFFFLQSVLQHVVVYLRDSWFDLTQTQRLVLCFITSNNPCFSLFDHFLWFGYDCLIRSSHEELPRKAAEYNKIVKNVLGILSQKTKKDANDLAIDFGISFSYCNIVIATCNKHFDKSLRNRMPYTRKFLTTY